MDAFEAIEMNKSSFSKMDRQIYGEMRKYTDNFAHDSITELRARFNFSQASLTRFAKRLGYAGFTEFQYQLAQDLTRRESEKYELSRADRYSYVLKNVQNTVDPVDVQLIVNKARKAGIVYLYGTSLSDMPAQLLCDVFKHNGIRSFCLTANDFFNPEFLIYQDDLVINFSISHGSFQRQLDALKRMKKKPSTILITQSKTHPLRDEFDQVVVLPSNPELYGEELVLSENLTYLMFIDMVSVELEKK